VRHLGSSVFLVATDSTRARSRRHGATAAVGAISAELLQVSRSPLDRQVRSQQDCRAAGRRFEQYQSYQKKFGFLFTSETLQSLDDMSLKSSCDNLGAVLTKDGKSDVDANDLYVELKFLQDFIPKENMGPLEILKFLKRHDCFPNASIAYRVLLTIPVTVASAERSFSKLKLLKSYLRSTMTQQRLNDLATIALESEVLEKIDYKHIIEDFISRNTKRMMHFM
jgi:hypothetical protein